VGEKGALSTGIRFENIEKRYGAIYALRRLSLEVSPGECIALAGRNGSGKTTLLRIAAQLVRPTRGDVIFTGGADHCKARVGYVAHATMAYDELSAEENLMLFARLQGVARRAERVRELLGAVGLAERGQSHVRTFSRGMRQRVAIARALLHAPSILLFDEPSTGLDPEGVAWLAATLRQLRDAGCTILMSVHGESEVAALATRAVRLEAGSVAADTRTGATLSGILSFADA
jgi:ABC-type multidrug transport system ATPase subunit